jgi:hypothetical protein
LQTLSTQLKTFTSCKVSQINQTFAVKPIIISEFTAVLEYSNTNLMGCVSLVFFALIMAE